MIGDYYARPLILAALRQPPLLYQGVRKILTNVVWHSPPITDLNIPLFGYGKNKMLQMDRNYLNESDIERCRLILAKRKKQTFTSVAVSMRNGTKESRSQGWCMNSYVVIRSAKGITEVEVQYRSTELVLKFTGDMLWLPRIAAKLGIQPNRYTFSFASCYLSGVYFPYICSVWEPIDFLELVYNHDRRLFEQGTRFFLRSSYRKDQWFPYSPENVAHRFAWSHLSYLQMRRIRDYLEERHKLFGKPLPKFHHQKGDYTPRSRHVGAEEED